MSFLNHFPCATIENISQSCRCVVELNPDKGEMYEKIEHYFYKEKEIMMVLWPITNILPIIYTIPEVEPEWTSHLKLKEAK